METTSQSCGHGGCHCTVAAGEAFCSDTCAQHAGEHEHTHGDGGCPCGHAPCAA